MTANNMSRSRIVTVRPISTILQQVSYGRLFCYGGRLLELGVMVCFILQINMTPRPQANKVPPSEASKVPLSGASRVPPSGAGRVPPLSYAIKIIPPKKMDFSIVKLRGVTAKFDSLTELKEAINHVCKDVSTEKLGYIEPGHGSKGKQQWLTSNEDLMDMYTTHNGKKEILLWGYSKDQSRKRRASSPGNQESSKRSRYDKHVDKMIEVEEIEEDLEERHGGEGYSGEQLRSWAHLIQLKKHSSYETPPKKRFWNIPSNGEQASTSSGVGSHKEVTVSPGKRVHLRGQCVQQLLQFHELLEKGATFAVP